MNINFYNKTCVSISKLTTQTYSTSFSLGVRMLSQEYQSGIYAIYGFVRFADEIVDTFHEHDQESLLIKFEEETWEAINKGISTNPIINSFQWVVNQYNIEHQLIRSFLDSMRMDLNTALYDQKELKKYIYGSAEVVGLMCLKIFYKDDSKAYEELKRPARKLGEAFQKINFLRDAKTDYQNLGRIYFENIDFEHFTHQEKIKIEKEIYADFKEAYKGIVKLKPQVRLGVYLAYRYYFQLFKKIKKAHPNQVLNKRYRISNTRKGILLAKSIARNKAGIF